MLLTLGASLNLAWVLKTRWPVLLAIFPPTNYIRSLVLVLKHRREEDASTVNASGERVEVEQASLYERLSYVEQLEWDELLVFQAFLPFAVIFLAIILLTEQHYKIWHWITEKILGKKRRKALQNAAHGGSGGHSALRDSDVVAEETRLLAAQTPEDVIVGICDVHLRYPATGNHAVKGVSLGVSRDQCFGLLGPNGAGKTSTISMLCGLTRISGGTIFLRNGSKYIDLATSPQVSLSIGFSSYHPRILRVLHRISEPLPPADSFRTCA